MILKARIYQARGTVFEPGEQISLRFDKCLGIARSDLGILNEDQALTLSILDGERDCAAHNLLDLTEQALYVHTQAAVTLFDQVLFTAFAERLAGHLPSRVLPVSTNPPQDMLTFLDGEFSQIKGLLQPGKRQRAEARGRLRHLMIVESNIAGDSRQPTDSGMEQVIRRVTSGETWQAIFPGTASLRLDTQGHGVNVAIRFTRELTAAPVRVIRPGEPGAEEAALVREVNLLDRFSMRLKELSGSLNLSAYVTLALIHHLRLQDDSDCYREFPMGKVSPFKRYSPLAFERLKQAKETADMDKVLQKYKER
jgi:hypothetical protein